MSSIREDTEITAKDWDLVTENNKLKVVIKDEWHMCLRNITYFRTRTQQQLYSPTDMQLAVQQGGEH